jgi:hypothetical protein
MSRTDRAAAEMSHESIEIIDTVKALIELYKSAFGEDWGNSFKQTVRVNVPDS